MGRDDTIIDDSENWSSQAVGIKDVSIRQFERCMLEGSKPFFGPDGQMQREKYINSIKSMEVILYPKILDTKNFKEININMKSNDEKIKSIKQKYAETYKRLKENNMNINESRLKDDLEQELIDAYREKLIILSILLEQVNYFSEVGIIE